MRKTAGRPLIGTSKVVNLTLPDDVWEKISIDFPNEKLSAALRMLILNAYQEGIKSSSEKE